MPNRTSWWFPALIGLFLALNLAPRPRVAAVALRRAQRWLREQPAAALADLEIAHRAWPERHDLALLAAEAATAAGRPDLVVAYLRHAERLAPLPAWAYARLAAAYQALEHPLSAQQALLRGLRRHPDDPSLWKPLADLALQLDDLTLARQALERLLAQHADPALRWQLALVLSAEDPAAALPHLQSLTTHPDYAPRARALREALQRALRYEQPAPRLTAAGRALAQQNAWRLARAAFRRALRHDPAFVAAWAYLGEAQDHLTADGLPALRHAQRLAPHDPLPSLLLGLHWLRRDRPARALPWLWAAVRQGADAPYLRIYLAQALARLPGGLAPALDILEQGAALAPYDAAYWQAYATFALHYTLPIQQALPIARHAAALAPHDPVARTLLARALLEVDDLTTAERLLVHVLRDDPGYAPAHLYLGLTALRRHDTQRAREHLRWAVRLAPDDATAALAQRLLARLR